MNNIRENFGLDRLEENKEFRIMPLGYGKASKEVRDYITNLQQENERANQYIDFYKDLVNKQSKRNSRQRLANQKQQELILKLQQENERLKKRNEEIYDGFLATQEELSKYVEKIELAKNELDILIYDMEEYDNAKIITKEELCKIFNILQENYTLEDCKSRCEKAIEYINHAQNYGTMAQVMPHLKPYVNGNDLLNILQNGSEDNE